MPLLVAKLFVACWVTLMSSVGVWLPIFLVRRGRDERSTALLEAVARGRRPHTTASFATTKLWLSLANFVSAGMLLTIALLHFFPESLEVESGASPDSVALCSWMLFGVLIPAVLERSIKVRGGHSHGATLDMDEEHAHGSGTGNSVSTSKLLIILMCFHGMTEGLLLGFENSVAALLSATVPLSGHKFCDGLVIGVSVAKEMHSEVEEDAMSDEADVEACIKANRSSNRFWRQLIQGPVGVWLLLTPMTVICVAMCAALLNGATPAVTSAGFDAAAPAALPVPSTAATTSSVSILAAVQAIGSGSFVYIGLTILCSEELKGMAANAALLAGVGLTSALFYITRGYH
ncbi:ZIP Zinc transporter family protein [Leishmania donovani]|uniref:ZIP Zinc transporter family protein n=2 Tax=Leishmania donovani TaxID=5661 RepID=A0A504Y6C8_LEIDO|nr:ZIP Zinc transporter family protein [Leishmania donovani]